VKAARTYKKKKRKKKRKRRVSEGSQKREEEKKRERKGERKGEREREREHIIPLVVAVPSPLSIVTTPPLVSILRPAKSKARGSLSKPSNRRIAFDVINNQSQSSPEPNYLE
jgi:hypothetical protein